MEASSCPRVSRKSELLNGTLTVVKDWPLWSWTTPEVTSEGVGLGEEPGVGAGE